ncbi:MAG: heavy metal sensor histidine kinase [Phycisphaerae bacterium]|nr:heavy metal sensor histidine kinase [Phycisphaerae bacterium]
MSSEQGKWNHLLTTIGARLTLWGTLITLFVCALVCVLLYVGVRFSLHREVDGFIEGEVQEFCAILVGEEDDDLDEIEGEIRRELGSRLRGDLTFRLLDADGRLMVTSNPDDRLPDPQALLQSAEHAAGAPWFETLALSCPPHSVRVCSQWTRLRDGKLCVAQATYALDRVAASLATFREVCVAAMLVAAVLSLIGGRILARRSLRPVHLMTETARQLGAGNLSRRLTRSGNGDELDRLAETLNAMLSRIESQFRRMQQFTADAAHELRTPLAALRGNAEVTLASDQDPGAMRQAIEESIQQYDHLARIAEDLLLLARLDAGEAILRPERLELDKTIEEMVDLYAPFAADHTLALRLGECERVAIWADKERVRQVLSNLLDNAVKYMNGRGRIDVSLNRANGLARITVSDSGPGIPAEDLPHIFDRFYRVDRARSRGGERGVGLGLPICRSIVEAHGGNIDIESRLGHGTMVTVLLPVNSSAPAATGQGP